MKSHVTNIIGWVILIICITQIWGYNEYIDALTTIILLVTCAIQFNQFVWWLMVCLSFSVFMNHIHMVDMPIEVLSDMWFFVAVYYTRAAIKRKNKRNSNTIISNVIPRNTASKN